VYCTPTRKPMRPSNVRNNTNILQRTVEVNVYNQFSYDYVMKYQLNILFLN